MLTVIFLKNHHYEIFRSNCVKRKRRMGMNEKIDLLIGEVMRQMMKKNYETKRTAEKLVVLEVDYCGNSKVSGNFVYAKEFVGSECARCIAEIYSDKGLLMLRSPEGVSNKRPLDCWKTTNISILERARCILVFRNVQDANHVVKLMDLQLESDFEKKIWRRNMESFIASTAVAKIGKY